MFTYNAISSHTDHFEIQKRDSEESLLTFVNLFPRLIIFSYWRTCPSYEKQWDGCSLTTLVSFRSDTNNS